jgi:hypothetical protein
VLALAFAVFLSQEVGRDFRASIIVVLPMQDIWDDCARAQTSSTQPATIMLGGRISLSVILR